MARSRRRSPIGLTGAGRDEFVMHLLVGGWPAEDVARQAGLYRYQVLRIKYRMCRKAETDIALARLKLWRQETARAA